MHSGADAGVAQAVAKQLEQPATARQDINSNLLQVRQPPAGRSQSDPLPSADTAAGSVPDERDVVLDQDGQGIALPSGLDDLLQRLEAEDAVYRRAMPLQGGPDDADAFAELFGLEEGEDMQLDARRGDATIDPRLSAEVESDEDDVGSDTSDEDGTGILALGDHGNEMGSEGGALATGWLAGGDHAFFARSRFAPMAASGRDRAATGPDAQAALSVGWWKAVQQRAQHGLELRRRVSSDWYGMGAPESGGSSASHRGNERGAPVGRPARRD